MRRVGTFTQAELAANLISSQHDGGGVAGSFTVSLTDGDAPGQSATVAVTLWNGPVIRGTGKADQLLGGEAGEFLSGLAGNDVLDGGPEGSYWLDGGTEIDIASYASSPRAVLINLPGQVTADGINTDTLVSIENAMPPIGCQPELPARPSPSGDGSGRDRLVHDLRRPHLDGAMADGELRRQTIGSYAGSSDTCRD